MLGRVIQSESIGRFNLRCCSGKRSLCFAFALINLVLNAWASAVQAQVPFSESATLKPKDTVSVRELQTCVKSEKPILQGVHCLRKGDAARGLSYFRRAVQESPDCHEAYYDEGLAELQVQRIDEALESFQKAIDLSSGHYARAYFATGKALSLLGRSKEAEAVLRRGVNEDPSLSEGYTAISILLINEDRFHEAEEMAHKALQMPDPFAWKALLPLAFVHERRGEYQAAVRQMESYVQHLRSEDKGLVQPVEKLLREMRAKAVSQHSP